MIVLIYISSIMLIAYLTCSQLDCPLDKACFLNETLRSSLHREACLISVLQLNFPLHKDCIPIEFQPNKQL